MKGDLKWLASTEDPRDGATLLVSGSTHYLNVYDDSGWRFSDESQTEFCSTMQSLPSPPPLVYMDGFTNALVFDDTLHVAWRGFAADFLASCLILIFGKGVGLQRACENAGLWARARGYSLSIDEFSLSDDKFPSVNAKGYEIKICCTWLAAWLQSMLSATGDISP
ncbi:unnamed protein product [Symbiodinium necroappetens]|uniref:Uncharacterized protein n=1 Tax=Symbiodinium necroappetens TaxID=1628268 RepID=A0A812XBE6_9DINO|nr:unnamed protein product [Symbiodinium necroappetens]